MLRLNGLPWEKTPPRRTAATPTWDSPGSSLQGGQKAGRRLRLPAGRTAAGWAAAPFQVIVQEAEVSKAGAGVRQHHFQGEGGLPTQ